MASLCMACFLLYFGGVNIWQHPFKLGVYLSFHSNSKLAQNKLTRVKGKLEKA